jgi:hypothetical protein
MGNTVASPPAGVRTQHRRVRELALDAISVMAFSVAVSIALVAGVAVMSRLVS